MVKQSNEMYSPHFRLSEFCCKCGNCAYSVPKPYLVVPEFASCLERVREKYAEFMCIEGNDESECGIYVIQGRVCDYAKTYSHELREERLSHVDGRAVDLVCSRLDLLYGAVYLVNVFSHVHLHRHYIHCELSDVAYETKYMFSSGVNALTEYRRNHGKASNR